MGINLFKYSYFKLITYSVIYSLIIIKRQKLDVNKFIIKTVLNIDVFWKNKLTTIVE